MELKSILLLWYLLLMCALVKLRSSNFSHFEIEHEQVSISVSHTYTQMEEVKIEPLFLIKIRMEILWMDNKQKPN